MISLTTMPKNPSMAILPVAMGTKNGSNQYTGRIFTSAKVGQCKVEIGCRTA